MTTTSKILLFLSGVIIAVTLLYVEAQKAASRLQMHLDVSNSSAKKLVSSLDKLAVSIDSLSAELEKTQAKEAIDPDCEE